METLEQLQREWRQLALKHKCLLTEETHFEAFYKLGEEPRISVLDNIKRHKTEEFCIVFSDGTRIPNKHESFKGTAVLSQFIKKIGVESISSIDLPNNQKKILTKDTTKRKEWQLKQIDNDWWVITKMPNPQKRTCIQNIINALAYPAEIKSR